MRWLLYNVLFTCGFPLVLPYFLLRMLRRGGYRRGFTERLGRYAPAVRRRLAERPRVWVHAVSVGEVFVARQVMRELRTRCPECAFVLSTTTSTGHGLAARELAAEDVLIYFPVDHPWVLRRVLGHLRLRALLLTECELWPNLIRMTKARGIPVALINGRLSAKSCAGYARLGLFFRPVLERLDLVLAQSNADAERFVRLGARPDAVRVTGNAKYDVAAADPASATLAGRMLAAAGFGADDLVLVGGSTWRGEEAALLDAYVRLRPAFPNLRLVLVPRHAERWPEVWSAIAARGLRACRRSQLGTGGAVAGGPPEVLLVDTTGELRHLYAAATVIFVGKSLTARGGQNPIEPAAYGKPVVIGPCVENFADVVRDFQEADAIVSVTGVAELAAALERLLAQPDLRLQYGRRAAAVVAAHQGATRAMAEALVPLLAGGAGCVRA